MRLVTLMLFMGASLAYARKMRKRNTEDIQEMAKYFAKYTQLPNAVEGVARVGFSSDDGKTAKDVENSPAFVESVMVMQATTGLAKTGRISRELLEESRRSRCGVSDPPKESDELGAYVVKSMWETKYDARAKLYPLTFSITRMEEIPLGVDAASVEEGILSAMCLWESNSNIRFMNIGYGNDLADITVSFAQGEHGDWYSFDGTGGTLAHAFYPENGRLHFDKSENWYLAKEGAVNYFKKDIFTVAAHELGHNIGLMHSEKRGALMAPIYKYAGTVEEYKLPQDDVNGVQNMYGRRIDSNPFEEPGTACNLMRKKFGIASDNLVTTEGSHVTRRHRLRATCKDDRLYRNYCPKWRKQGYCDHPEHGRTLRRRCKRSCNFCPVKPLSRKPRNEEASKISHSICGIDHFDSVAVILDARNVLSMMYFKDDYYFESSMVLDSNSSESYSLLETNEDLGDAIQWMTDPKTIKVGSYQIQQPDMFAMSEHVSAVLVTKKWYLAFEKGAGIIHIYTFGTPTTVYLGNFTIKSTFHGYPHKSIDAGFVEYNAGDGNDTVYTLFHNDLMWQYRQIAADPTQELDKEFLQVEAIESKHGVPIQQWHGVPACRVDAVFQYKGIPYFVKGNTFWPAVDTEPIIPRDITYNFLRCWQEEPIVNPTPPLCEATYGKQTTEEDDRNSAHRNSSFFQMMFLMMIAVFILSK